MNIVLEPIADDPVTITNKLTDGTEKVYKADPEMTATEALSFITAVASGATPTTAPDEFVRNMAAILGRCLAPYQPELASADAVLKEFSLRKIWAVVAAFLALNGQLEKGLETPSAAPAPQASENASPTTPTTQEQSA